MRCHSIQAVASCGFVSENVMRMCPAFASSSCADVTGQALSWSAHCSNVHWSCCEQVLPNGMVVLAEPNPDSLLAALEEAVARVHTVNPQLQHEQVASHTVALPVMPEGHCGYMYRSTHVSLVLRMHLQQSVCSACLASWITHCCILMITDAVSTLS